MTMTLGLSGAPAAQSASEQMRVGIVSFLKIMWELV
jgi:hypothetical protein